MIYNMDMQQIINEQEVWLEKLTDHCYQLDSIHGYSLWEEFVVTWTKQIQLYSDSRDIKEKVQWSNPREI